jgi:hypothetical protein
MKTKGILVEALRREKELGQGPIYKDCKRRRFDASHNLID